MKPKFSDYGKETQNFVNEIVKDYLDNIPKYVDKKKFQKHIKMSIIDDISHLTNNYMYFYTDSFEYYAIHDVYGRSYTTREIPQSIIDDVVNTKKYFKYVY